MLAGLFFQKISVLFYTIAQVALLGSIALTCIYFPTQAQTLYDGMFLWNAQSAIISLILLVFGVLVFAYNARTMVTLYQRAMEPYLLMLFSVLGMLVMVSANHWMPLYIGIEIMSLPIYALIALQREKFSSVEAGMKYFILGSIASAILLFGISFIYGTTGQLGFETLMQNNTATAYPLLLLVGLIFTFVGLSFKFGLAPFQMGLPDVYEGSSDPVTLFVGTLPKIAVLAVILQVMKIVWAYTGISVQEFWIVIGFISLVMGNLIALVQYNLKRLLAYATIAQMGYVIFAVSMGNSIGDFAAFFYLIAYVLATVLVFGAIVILNQSGLQVTTVSDLAGLASRSKLLAFSLLIGFLSMLGIPPLFGFFGKLSVLMALIDNRMVELAIVVVFMTLVSAVYYLRLINQMYFQPSEKLQAVIISLPQKIVLVVNIILLIGLGFVAQHLSIFFSL